MAASVFVAFFANIILELFYPDSSFLNELTDMDELQRYNTINLAECGADPDVVENNGVWPLTPVQREDGVVTIPLATFDTKPTHVTNVEELETNYKKAQSVLRQHVNTLQTKCAMSAAYNIAPASNTASTPVLKTTGADRGDGTKALRYEDITELSLAFDNANLPQEGRVLVLCPEHKTDLKNANMKLFKAMMSDKSIDTFKIYTFTGNPRYNTADGTKQPYGALTGAKSSIAFCKSEVMRSMGDKTAKVDERWADYRGWLIGAQVRFVAMPFRKSGIAAIYSDNAA